MTTWRSPGWSASTTSRSRSATSTRRSLSTGGCSPSSCAGGCRAWRSSTWATSSSPSPRAGASRPTRAGTSGSWSTTARRCGRRSPTRASGRGAAAGCASMTRGATTSRSWSTPTSSSPRRPRCCVGWSSRGSRRRTRRAASSPTRAWRSRPEVGDPLAGVELPVVQAGMGGGIARHELAAAVSEAGGLGTIGHAEPGPLARELAAARALTRRPVAVNVLLPFARARHWEVAARADVVVTFWGAPRRRTDGVWLHQCGSVEEALAARAAGADGVIAQGEEAGGHVRGRTGALELLERARAALPDCYPILLAGGIAVAADVRAALAAGARAAVCGTRFVLAEESRAHPEYRRRLVAGRETLLTEIFGLGWPAAPHRVLPNRATERWAGAPAPAGGGGHSPPGAGGPAGARGAAAGGARGGGGGGA